MNLTATNRRTLALGASLFASALSPVSLGAVNEYTTYAGWLGVPGSTVLGSQNFSSLASGYHASANGTAGGVSWNAAASGNFYVSTVNLNVVLGTNIANETLTFNFAFAGGLSGVAGNFFALDSGFSFASDTVSVLVTLSDSSTQSFSRSITSFGQFWGFHSTGSSIASIAISVAGSGNYSTTDGFVLMSGGTGPVVPLPGAAGLAAIALAGLSRRRRR